jgi:fructoselysine-6-P-deglycase FrlB-like protein
MWIGRTLGKPFESELGVLAATYKWSRNIELGALREFADRCRWRALFAVGSGGSFSVASYAAFLQQRRGSLGQVVTPLELSAASALRRNAVMFFSAGGNNSDVLRGFHIALKGEADSTAVLCLRPGSKLTCLAASYESCHLWTETAPAGRDGFLATNSLLAFFVLTYRVFANQDDLPETYEDLTALAVVRGAPESILAKDHLVVLYSPSTKAAAVDLESKMSEAGLASVQLTDYRNFAHGRHNWIAKKAGQTGVLAFVAEEADDIARRTLHELRNVCATVTVRTKARDLLASLACLPLTFELTRIAGKLRNIDPGRPGVPAFGRRIYNLRPRLKGWIVGTPPPIDSIVDRKLELIESSALPEREKMQQAVRTYATKLRKGVYEAVVFDFDNTLCGAPERFGVLRRDIVSELTRLASTGIWIGIATGRGKSVRVQLQQSLDKEVWQRFVIGYYNGAEIGKLGENDKPFLHEERSPLASLGELIASDSVLREICQVTIRSQQVTVEPTKPVSTEWLWREVLRVTSVATTPISVVHSTRSVDVLPLGCSKMKLLAHFRELGIEKYSILCVGDLGQFPGNDYQLLAHPHSLSCDKPSETIEGCWNYAPIGFRGVQATLYYLGKLQMSKRGLRLRLPEPR